MQRRRRRPARSRSSTPVGAHAAAAGRRGSCRRGRRSRRETAAGRRRSRSSTSTYFGDAMLPSSTTSQSGPISRAQRARALLERPAVGRVVGMRRRRRANARTAAARHRRVRAAQAGVRRDDVDAAADDRVAGLGRRGEPPRVGQLAAEVQAADEGEDVAERRALAATAAARPARSSRAATAPACARVPPQFAGERRKTRRHADRSVTTA